MWNANANDGQPVEVKLPKSVKIEFTVHELVQEYADEAMWDKHEEVIETMEGRDAFLDLDDIKMQVNVDTKTGKMTIVGIGGHPIDFSKVLR